MRTTIMRAALAACAILTAGASLGQTMPAKVADTSKGKALVDAKGMTLYWFDRDTTAGKSACNGPCAASWPAFAAGMNAKDEGKWTVITRDDGAKQWAYGGKPLYTWSKDGKPGDATGDGFNGLWHVATP